MFTKKVIGRYSFHFGEGSNKQLSVCHKIYEKGFLEFEPYGGKEKDTTNAILNTIINYYTKKGVLFNDFFH